MEYESSTLDDLLRDAVATVTRLGDVSTATRGSFRELRGSTLRLKNPRCRISWSDMRGTLFSAVGELLWYLSGRDDVEFIAYYVTAYRKEAEENGTIAGAYGPRLVGGPGGGQLAHVTSMLRDHPSTRRAVIQLFDRKDVSSIGRLHDVPCTCVLQFLIRDDKLDLVTFMRSSDVYLGLPHDIFAFTMIQELVASELGVSLGEYVHMAGSLHLYEHDIADAEVFLGEHFMPERPMPEMPQGDHRESIQDLLEIEACARGSMEIKELIRKLSGLSAYWQDIGLLIVAFSAWRKFTTGVETPQRTIEALFLIKEQAPTSFYSDFVLKKIDAVRRKCR
jgi:thymidylate synthase